MTSSRLGWAVADPGRQVQQGARDRLRPSVAPPSTGSLLATLMIFDCAVRQGECCWRC